MAKVKDKSVLAKFNRFLSVVLILLVIATAVIVIVSPAKVAEQQGDTSGEFVDEAVIDELKPGTYGGVDFKTTDDVVNYYVECYNNTKTMTVDGTYDGSPIKAYKLLGDETLDVKNLLVEGKSNDTINKLVPGIVGGLFTGGVKSLSPGNSLEPKNDWQEASSGKIDRTVSHLTADDVLACNVTDNGDGTITMVIQPKAQLLAIPGEDSQGRFFNVLGDISGVVSSISILSFSEGSVDDNFVVNYAGGTGTIKINVANKEIVEADYNMHVHIDVTHANVAILKDKSASLDIDYSNHFPASEQYLKDHLVTIKK